MAIVGTKKRGPFMWIFCYGSLMSDDWELNHGCIRRQVAELAGYQRVFNKASVKNWGTKGCPCPTLNLRPVSVGSCSGIAFEFANSQKNEVDSYLTEREGNGFKPTLQVISVEGVGTVQATVRIYSNENIISDQTDEDLVAAVKNAIGTRGACADYVAMVYEQLAKLGIDDPAVTQLWKRVHGIQ